MFPGASKTTAAAPLFVISRVVTLLSLNIIFAPSASKIISAPASIVMSAAADMLAIVFKITWSKRASPSVPANTSLLFVALVNAVNTFSESS